MTELKQKRRTLRSDLRELGLDEESVERMYRLLKGKPTPQELERWEQVNIMKDGKILASKDEFQENAGITICLYDLAYRGILERLIKDEKKYEKPVCKDKDVCED